MFLVDVNVTNHLPQIANTIPQVLRETLNRAAFTLADTVRAQVQDPLLRASVYVVTSTTTDYREAVKRVTELDPDVALAPPVTIDSPDQAAVAFCVADAVAAAYGVRGNARFLDVRDFGFVPNLEATLQERL